MRWMVTILICAVVPLGCATDKTKTQTGTKPAPAAHSAIGLKGNVAVKPSLQLTGKIVSVNAALQFVVAAFHVGEMPSLNERFSVYRQGQKVGEVKISGPQEETNIVADITAGEVQLSDELRRE